MSSYNDAASACVLCLDGVDARCVHGLWLHLRQLGLCCTVSDRLAVVDGTHLPLGAFEPKQHEQASHGACMRFCSNVLDRMRCALCVYSRSSSSDNTHSRQLLSLCLLRSRSRCTRRLAMSRSKCSVTQRRAQPRCVHSLMRQSYTFMHEAPSKTDMHVRALCATELLGALCLRCVRRHQVPSVRLHVLAHLSSHTIVIHTVSLARDPHTHCLLSTNAAT